MDEDRMSWSELVEFSRGEGLLAQRLYVVFSEPIGGLGPIHENIDRHLAYQAEREADGTMFAAGPVATDDERHWLGEGMFAYRADSIETARRLADGDPMHQAGARSYRIRPWLLNEGTTSVRVYYSGRKPLIG
jgi:hypothetical protein